MVITLSANLICTDKTAMVLDEEYLQQFVYINSDFNYPDRALRT